MAYVTAEPYHTVNDSATYNRMAHLISIWGDYHVGNGPHTAAAGSRGPTAYFPPAFPYLLAVADLIDGHQAGGPTAVGPERIEMAALGTASVGLIGLVALEAFGEGPALAALALAAVYPVFVELSGTLVAENLAVALELAAAWAALRSRRAQGRRIWAWLAAAGLLTGLCALAHENAALYVLPIAAAGWAAARARGLRAGRALAAPAVVAICTALAIAPWTVRNLIVMHSFIPISDEAGITLLGTYNAQSAANPHVPYKWRLFIKIPRLHSLRVKAHHETEPQLSGTLQTEALNYIGAHPLAPLEVFADNTLRMFELEGTYAWQASAHAIGLRLAVARIGVYGFWILCLLAIAGLFTRAARAAPRWLWAMPILYWISIAPINVETPRFREPIDPFFVLLAACAVSAGARRLLSGLSGAPVGRDRGPREGPRTRQLVEMSERLA
ncbi:MAG: glycosyltransferase family 39 protein [Solirubrobacteraceae bacterium]